MPLKPISKKPAPPVRDAAKEFDLAIDQVMTLQKEIDSIKRDELPQLKEAITQQVTDTKQFIIDQAREHFDMRESRIVERLWGMLSAEPIWETHFEPGLGAKDPTAVDALYRKGWRYLGTAFNADNKMGGTIYHRPKLPKTFDEFKAMYEGIGKAKATEKPVIQAKKSLAVPTPKKPK